MEMDCQDLGCSKHIQQPDLVSMKKFTGDNLSNLNPKC